MRKPSPLCDFAVLFDALVSKNVYGAQWPGLPVRCPTRQNRLWRGSERSKTFYTPSSPATKRLHNLDETKSSFKMANCCPQDWKIDFNACNNLAIRASKVANRPLSSAILNLNVSFKTGPEFLTGFSRPHEFTKPVGLKKSTLKNGLKNVRFRCADSLVPCGRKAESYLKKYAVSKVYGA